MSYTKRLKSECKTAGYGVIFSKMINNMIGCGGDSVRI